MVRTQDRLCATSAFSAWLERVFAILVENRLWLTAIALHDVLARTLATMKSSVRLVLTVVFALIMGIPTAKAADPCAALLCLTGAAQEQSGGPGCQEPMQAFFSIRVFDPITGFDEAATAAARAAFLSGCFSPANAWAHAAVIAVYGARFDGP